MTNEIKLNNSSFGVEYVPAQLSMNNFDDMKEVVKSFSDKYKGFVFTAEDKHEATAARSELLDLRNAIDTERKNVKKEYNKPLKEFESKINSLTKMIDEPLNDIRDGLKQIDEGEREQRESHLNEYLRDVCKENDLDLEGIETSPNWLNKGMFTKNMNLTSKLKKEIQEEVEKVINEEKRHQENVDMLTAFCETKGINPSGWVSQLDYKSPTEIMDEIHREEKRKQEYIDNMKEQKEEKEEPTDDLESSNLEETKEPESSKHVIDDLEELFTVEEQEEKTLVVYGTKQEIQSVMDFMKQSNIRFDEQLDLITDLPF